MPAILSLILSIIGGVGGGMLARGAATRAGTAMGTKVLPGLAKSLLGQGRGAARYATETLGMGAGAYGPEFVAGELFGAGGAPQSELRIDPRAMMQQSAAMGHVAQQDELREMLRLYGVDPDQFLAMTPMGGLI